MNKVILMGRIVRDLEYKATTTSGYTRFTVAVDRPKMKNEEKAGSDFINCVAWGKTAENVCKFFGKGNKILLEGSLRIGSYENKDGAKVSTADVYVSSFDFIESKQKTTETRSTPMQSMGTTVPFEEEVPF